MCVRTTVVTSHYYDQVFAAGLSMAERERTIVTHALYRLNDPVFVAALSPRDRSSISQPVAHFCEDQETEMSSKEEEEGSGNHLNWPGTN